MNKFEKKKKTTNYNPEGGNSNAKILKIGNTVVI